jgi:hypothetical protein
LLQMSVAECGLAHRPRRNGYGVTSNGHGFTSNRYI